MIYFTEILKKKPGDKPGLPYYRINKKLDLRIVVSISALHE